LNRSAKADEAETNERQNQADASVGMGKQGRESAEPWARAEEERASSARRRMLHRWVALEAPRDPLGAGDGNGGESIGARDASRLFVAKHQREIIGLVRFGHSDLQLAGIDRRGTPPSFGGSGYQEFFGPINLTGWAQKCCAKLNYERARSRWPVSCYHRAFCL